MASLCHGNGHTDGVESSPSSLPSPQQYAALQDLQEEIKRVFGVGSPQMAVFAKAVAVMPAGKAERVSASSDGSLYYGYEDTDSEASFGNVIKEETKQRTETPAALHCDGKPSTALNSCTSLQNEPPSFAPSPSLPKPDTHLPDFTTISHEQALDAILNAIRPMPHPPLHEEAEIKVVADKGTQCSRGETDERRLLYLALRRLDECERRGEGIGRALKAEKRHKEEALMKLHCLTDVHADKLREMSIMERELRSVKSALSAHEGLVREEDSRRRSLLTKFLHPSNPRRLDKKGCMIALERLERGLTSQPRLLAETTHIRYHLQSFWCAYESLIDQNATLTSLLQSAPLKLSSSSPCPTPPPPQPLSSSKSRTLSPAPPPISHTPQFPVSPSPERPRQSPPHNNSRNKSPYVTKGNTAVTQQQQQQQQHTKGSNGCISRYGARERERPRTPVRSRTPPKGREREREGQREVKRGAAAAGGGEGGVMSRSAYADVLRKLASHPGLWRARGGS
ncbi:unnamed protein product [Vitrella brassicaformis CCMP3155]|uniref:Uncharacterized protein n=1 Tax=Vitrella brassicaformis (strain CCMP3155) TaxID=1169540 RepID=A0A0G4H1E8_VITBC|nr:unnamed protein product [Vitrella brassicaformis CCMP3155]|eukprot:CEM37416.1 unnamed protein product [Vitrella brassicaformis CCMP3155]